MPVNAKGRLKYLDFLSTFSSEKAATPPATDDSAKAQRGSSVPEVSEGGRSAGSSPTRNLRTGSKQQSHPCVSSRFWASHVALHRAPTPQAGGLVSPTGWG